MPRREGPFLQLDYLYTPSDDVAADVRYFTEVLGGKLAFAIDSMGARVAKIDLSGGPPYVLLTDHLEGDRPILVYRVADLDASLKQLKKNGWKKGTKKAGKTSKKMSLPHKWGRLGRGRDTPYPRLNRSAVQLSSIFTNATGL